jgi:hypothetical protein
MDPRSRPLPGPRATRPSLPLAFLLVLFLGSVPAARTAAAADPFDGLAKTFRDELATDKAETRLHAFQMVSASKDVRAVDLLIEGVAKEVARRDVYQRTQEKWAQELEKVLGDIEKSNAAKPPESPREIEAYNKRMKKLADTRDALNERLRDVAVDLVQEASILSAGSAAVATVVGTLAGSDLSSALARVEEAWMKGPKALPDDRLRWVDVLTRLKGPGPGERLSLLVRDEAADPRVRAAAVEARVTRSDAGALEDALAALPSTSFPVQAAAVEALKRLHRKEAIDPLIALLAREDLGEVRTRVHRALRSLTGEKHGPYAQPWKDWWQGARATFVPPEKAADAEDLVRPEKGLTFYGITTFSDKILFVLDVSGSMLDPAHPEAAGARANERRIDVLRKEFAGAVDMLDEKKKFNVLLFNHRVIRYQAGALVGDRAARDAAKRWALAVEPSSGTNIHDSLETAFRLANTAADGKNYQAVFDTIYFMTDGTPTAGKLQKSADILEAVATWNRTAKVTVHCIAVGDGADVKFLSALATANHGQFVKR